ncbi:interleukin-17B [Anolis carolinensis]|uniref:interleukin-17B n=1 Tax=Anolis carolinensis TaxID=28377 RepID=UPI0002038AA8|nr:PREDICTED: interleukin-17B [Anolis carolinensis]|eukprot:XP_008102874.2 PREDICTED: interleukin-17B [Anolis carolinensis]
MEWAPKLVVFYALCLSFTLETKDVSKATKGKKKGSAKAKDQRLRLQNSSPDPLLRVNLGASADYTPVEDYERSIHEMVTLLKNSSEPMDSKCQVNLRLWMSNKRSLSPWAYRINHDPARIPVDIPEAHCLCTGCINPFTMQEDRTMVSIPIYSKIPVHRLLCEPSKSHKKKKRCHKEHKMVMEIIAVGCTCIF